MIKKNSTLFPNANESLIKSYNLKLKMQTLTKVKRQTDLCYMCIVSDLIYIFTTCFSSKHGLQWILRLESTTLPVHYRPFLQISTKKKSWYTVAATKDYIFCLYPTPNTSSVANSCQKLLTIINHPFPYFQFLYIILVLNIVKLLLVGCIKQ